MSDWEQTRRTAGVIGAVGAYAIVSGLAIYAFPPFLIVQIVAGFLAIAYAGVIELATTETDEEC